MIQGRVNSNYEATLVLELHGSSGRVIQIEAVVDTGFTEFLALPPGVISQLAFPFENFGRLVLADGSSSTFNVHIATVLWNGEQRIVPAHQSNAKPLIGMALLENYSLCMDVVEGGRVTIEAIT